MESKMSQVQCKHHPSDETKFFRKMKELHLSMGEDINWFWDISTCHYCGGLITFPRFYYISRLISSVMASVLCIPLFHLLQLVPADSFSVIRVAFPLHILTMLFMRPLLLSCLSWEECKTYSSHKALHAMQLMKKLCILCLEVFVLFVGSYVVFLSGTE